MCGEHAVGQKLTEVVLGPPVHNAVNDAVQVRARVDVVGDAGGDDREDRRGALAAVVEPREEPILATEDEPPELALASVIGGLDVSVLEKEQQAWPLPMQGNPSATDVLGGGVVLWQAGHLAAPAGRRSVGAFRAQQRLNFFPEPQGQGALRPGLGGRIVWRPLESADSTTA